MLRKLLFIIQLFLFSYFFTNTLKAQNFNQEKILNLVEILSHDSLQGRAIGSGGSLKAQRLIKENFEKYNLEKLPARNSYEFKFSIKKLKGVNLIGYLKGTRYPEKFIVVSAHYDHVGIQAGRVFNGADDNASGVGGLVALMEYFSNNKPDHSILFAAFDGEETDLSGSRAFTASLPLPKENIILNINMDMISRSDRGELYACGTGAHPFLKKYLEGISPGGIELKLGHDGVGKTDNTEDWTYSSDHASFHALRIPFIYFGVEDHQDYHKSTDDFERIDKDFYIAAIGFIIRAIDILDRQYTGEK